MNTERKDISFATLNTFFDGYDVTHHQGDKLIDWSLAHLLVLRMQYIPMVDVLVRRRQQRSLFHPAEEVLSVYKPDVMILQEVMPNLNDGKTIGILESQGYQIFIGTFSGGKKSLQRTTVIGSKYPGEQVTDFKIPGLLGGGSCGLAIPEFNLTLLAVHLSAFNRHARRKQLEYVASFLEDIYTSAPTRNIVLTGDFNCEFDEIKPHLEKYPLAHLTLPSFPHSDLWQELSQDKWIPSVVRQIMSLTKGRKSLDHFFIPDEWMYKLWSKKTRSDHLGLILRAQVGESTFYGDGDGDVEGLGDGPGLPDAPGEPLG